MPCSKQTAINTKPRIYRAVLEPILSHGAECWQLSNKNKRKIVEMNFLRRAKSKFYTTIDTVETRQLINYEHVMRKIDNRSPKGATEYAQNQNERR